MFVFNEDIAAMNGQSSIKHQIIYQMYNCSYSIFEIIGEHGCGKHTLSNQIAQEWEKQSKCKIVKLRAIEKNPISDYDVFSECLSNATINSGNIIRIFTESLKDIPYIGNTASVLANTIIKTTDKHFHTVSDEELFYYQRFQYLIKKGNILFICDDFNKWDIKSQILFTKIVFEISNAITHSGVFVLITSNIRYFTNNQLKTSTFQIRLISENDFSSVIKILFPKACMSEETLNAYYKLTHGNLRLIHDSLMFIVLSNAAKNCQIEKLLFEFIKKKVGADKSASVNQLLKESAFLGKTVSESLLKEFSELVFDEFEETLGTSIDKKILSIHNHYINFYDEALFHLYKSNPITGYKYYNKLANCIKLLYPSRYDLQYLAYKNGQMDDDASEKMILYILSYARDGHLYKDLSKEEEQLLRKSEYYDFFLALIKAYKYYNDKNYESAEKIARDIYPKQISIRFEKDYLLGLISTNMHCNIDFFIEQIDVLSKYVSEDFKNQYPEMFIRNCMLLVEFCSEVSDYSKMNYYVDLFNKAVQEYGKTDENILHFEYRLKIKANSIYKIEIAHKWTQDAVNYFESKSKRGRFVSKYYISLLNHSANEIVIGNYENGLYDINKAYEIAKQYPDMASLNRNVLHNNLILAKFLTKKLNASNAFSEIKNFISVEESSADQILLKNNAGTFLALSGDIKGSLKYFSDIYESIIYDENIDDYYAYFITNNYGVILWLNGEKTESDNILLRLKKLNPLPKDSAYFKKRNDELLNYISNNIPSTVLTCERWNNVLYDREPKAIGKAWKFWSQLLLFTELQIWSDC